MEKILQQITQICQSYGSVTKAVLFGSRARGDHAPTSDFDLALFLKSNQSSPPQKQETLPLLHELDEVDCLQKLDIVLVTENTDSTLLQNIEREGIVLVERKSKLENLKRAVLRLEEAVALCQENPCSFYFDALIQRFEFSTELAWKTCKEYLQDQGFTEVNGPKPVMREAFSARLIEEGDIWISILTDRNRTSHIYDEDTAGEIARNVMNQYLLAFQKLVVKLSEEMEKI